MLYKNDEMVHNETIFGLESTQLKFGRNSLNELGWELSKYNSTKILLVVDPVLHDFDVTQKILDQIKSSGAEVIIFDNISVEPTLKSFEVASQFALENSFDLIVAAGGGSTIDTAKTVLDSVIVNVLPSDKYFNDLMELRDIIAQHYTFGSETDKEALVQYSIAERLLQQYKLVEAAEMLAFIRENYPDVSILPIVMLRECLLRSLLEDVSISLNIAQLLQETPFAPQGITIQGEINEQFYGDIDKAMKFYNNLLEAYPMSMLAEPVRMRMRQLKNVVES